MYLQELVKLETQKIQSIIIEYRIFNCRELRRFIMAIYHLYFNECIQKIDSRIICRILNKTDYFTIYSYENPLGIDFNKYNLEECISSNVPISSAVDFNVKNYRFVFKSLYNNATVIRFYTDCKTSEKLMKNFEMSSEIVDDNCVRCVLKIDKDLVKYVDAYVDDIRSSSFIKNNQVIANLFLDNDRFTCTYFGDVRPSETFSDIQKQDSVYIVDGKRREYEYNFESFFKEMVDISEHKFIKYDRFSNGFFSLYFSDYNQRILLHFDVARKYIKMSMTDDDIEYFYENNIDLSDFIHIKDYSIEESCVYNPTVINIFESPLPDNDLQNWIIDSFDNLE